MVKKLPDLSRTLAALKRYDKRLPQLMRVLDKAQTDAELRTMMIEIEKLEESVGAAYGLDTADRNSPETCRGVVRPGPAVPPPGQELSFVRRMVAQWQADATP